MISNLPSVKAVGILGDKYVDGPRKRAKLWRRKDSLREERAVRVGGGLWDDSPLCVDSARSLLRACFSRATVPSCGKCRWACAPPSIFAVLAGQFFVVPHHATWHLQYLRSRLAPNFGTHGNQERSAMVSHCARATLSRAPQAVPAWHAKPFSPSGLRFLQGLWRKKCGCLPRSRACTLVRLCFYGLCRLNRSSPTCEGAPAREVATCLHGTRWMWSAGESRRMRL